MLTPENLPMKNIQILDWKRAFGTLLLHDGADMR